MQYFNKPGLLGWITLAILVSLLKFGVATAGDAPVMSGTGMDVAISAVDNKDYAKAFELFTPLAEAGNPEAQYNLAMLYRTGKGTQKDLSASYVWFRRAADQGIPDAQYYVGFMFDSGEGVEKSPKYASVWYRKAAEQGHGLAQINLGFLYANGSGVQQDTEQAYLWFHVAAAQGYKVAFENKNIIEESIKEQEDGAAKLEVLKGRARDFFQQYVGPFGEPPKLHSSSQSSPHQTSPH